MLNNDHEAVLGKYAFLPPALDGSVLIHNPRTLLSCAVGLPYQLVSAWMDPRAGLNSLSKENICPYERWNPDSQVI